MNLDKENIDRSKIRIAIVIEQAAIMMLIGIIFIAAAIADGFAQIIIGVLGVLVISAIAHNDNSKEELRSLGLFVTDDENPES